MAKVLYMDRSARFSSGVLNADSLLVVLGTVCMMCAWGVLKWRPWGHALALALFGFEFVIGGRALLVGDSGLLYPAAACLVLSWLLLPRVRAAYWRRESTA